jgi:hypothetical protein
LKNYRFGKRIHPVEREGSNVEGWKAVGTVIKVAWSLQTLKRFSRDFSNSLYIPVR